MAREDKIRDAARQLTGEDVLDIAICHPEGYVTAEAAGAVAGGSVAGFFGNDFAVPGALLGTVASGRLFAKQAGLPGWLILAVTPTHVYVMGTHEYHQTDLTPVVRFDRAHLHVQMTSGLTRHITLTDTEHNVSMELQGKRFGTRGLKALIELLELSERHAAPDED
jgi:hypothetical protein